MFLCHTPIDNPKNGVNKKNGEEAMKMFPRKSVPVKKKHERCNPETHWCFLFFEDILSRKGAKTKKTWLKKKDSRNVSQTSLKSLVYLVRLGAIDLESEVNPDPGCHTNRASFYDTIPQTSCTIIHGKPLNITHTFALLDPLTIHLHCLIP